MPLGNVCSVARRFAAGPPVTDGARTEFLRPGRSTFHIMPKNRRKNKVEAIYDVRQAAEEKARAEQELRESPTPGARDALLDAQIDLEAKTLDAIEACNECGHVHRSTEPHQRVMQRFENVLDVDFERGS